MDLRQTGEWTTEGTAPVTSDLRTPGGLRASLAALHEEVSTRSARMLELVDNELRNANQP